jgi:hypothetical protein
MRALADVTRIQRLMHALGAAADADGSAHLAGGATAVLLGWRPSTIDVDITFVPERDALLRALPTLKETLQINVELASPVHFIPVPTGWEERGLFATREGRLTFYHFDLYAQALAKLERAHAQDLHDVESMLDAGLVEPERALEYFDRIEPELYRYPAVDPRSFRERVKRAFAGAG